MNTTTTILKYVVGVSIVLVLGGVAGWFFYLNYQTRATNATDAARGYSTTSPSFGTSASNIQNNVAGSLGSDGTVGTSDTSPASPLWQVDTTPVAGFSFVSNSIDKTKSIVIASTTPPLYFAERANGNIFSADAGARTVSRITNTLKTKTYEAFFGPNGDIIERSIGADGTVMTFAGKVATTSGAAVDTTSTSTPDALKGFYLAPNIKMIVMHPTTGDITYTVASAEGGIDVITQPWGSTKGKTLFSSPIGSWRISVLADNRTVLLESPADDVVGYAYSLGSGGALTTIVRTAPGLSILPDPGSGAVIYSTSAHGNVTLFSQVSSKTAPVALSIATIADKCVWLGGKAMIAYCAVPETAPSGTFINDWYRGAVHTTDAWWKVDVNAGTATLVYSPSSSNLSLDVENPIIDSSGNYIAFGNAVDKSLWVWHVTN